MLLHHLKHNQVLHEKVMLMSIVTEEIPQVDEADRVAVPASWARASTRSWPITASWRRRTCPRCCAALARDSGNGRPVAVTPTSTTFYLGRETLIATDGRRRARAAMTGSVRMARWRKKLFIVMTRNAQSATAFFSLPPNRVVELGAQIQF